MQFIRSGILLLTTIIVASAIVNSYAQDASMSALVPRTVNDQKTSYAAWTVKSSFSGLPGESFKKTIILDDGFSIHINDTRSSWMIESPFSNHYPPHAITQDITFKLYNGTDIHAFVKMVKDDRGTRKVVDELVITRGRQSLSVTDMASGPSLIYASQWDSPDPLSGRSTAIALYMINESWACDIHNQHCLKAFVDPF